jgi:methylmalonyl-CoA mutase N-terminal domain/subunit
VAIDSVEDMEKLFAEIRLCEISTSMTINATASILLAFYLAVARKQNTPWNELRGTVQNDVLKEYIARGTYIYPPSPSLRLVIDLVDFCSREVPLWNSVSVSGYHIREAGSTASQEIAFTLANGETYVRAAMEKGMQIDEFAPQISFFFNSHNDLFEEVAKFRAARRIWAELMRDRYGARNPRSQMLRFHTQTAGSSLTAQQPDNNAVRVTLQALAAILGGTQSLHTNSRDEALALPTEESARLAIRTQQILASESGVPATPDPLAGSWYLESLTKKIVADVESYLEKIREMGGMLGAIERGYIQKEIQDSAYSYQRSLEERERLIVGVNCYTESTRKRLETWKANPEGENLERKKLTELRSRRDRDAVEAALSDVRAAAVRGANVLPSMIEAADVKATVGEIASALRDVFGEYEERVVI